MDNSIKNIEDYEQVEFVTDLYELYLSSVDHLVKGNPKETTKYHSKIVQFASEMP